MLWSRNCDGEADKKNSAPNFPVRCSFYHVNWQVLDNLELFQFRLRYDTIFPTA